MPEAERRGGPRPHEGAPAPAQGNDLEVGLPSVHAHPLIVYQFHWIWYSAAYGQHLQMQPVRNQAMVRLPS